MTCALAACLGFVCGVGLVWKANLFIQRCWRGTGLIQAAPAGLARFFYEYDYKNNRRTGHDFGEFWAEFRAAVLEDDKEKLFGMTRHDRFVGVGKHLQLEFKPWIDGYVIKSYPEFLRNYRKLFPTPIKRGIQYGTPDEAWEGSYYLFWKSDTNYYEAMFDYIEGEGYKFTGIATGRL